MEHQENETRPTVKIDHSGILSIEKRAMTIFRDLCHDDLKRSSL